MKKQIIFTNALLTMLCGLILSTSIIAQVKTWGWNDYGQIGDGTSFNNRPSPTILSSLTDIIDIHGGSSHTLAVKADGTVLAWGRNIAGQLGNGTIEFGGCFCKPTPGAVLNLTNVIAVSGGVNHSLALKADGTVWAWGDNLYGQIGNGTTIRDNYTPVQVGVGIAGFNDIIAIDAGRDHNLALKSDGTVWAWGYNNSGQIGDGTGSNRLSPVPITSLSNNILAVSAGAVHSMALTKTGRVYVWGGNARGELGNGAAGGIVATPTLNTNISSVAQIQAGSEYSVALKSDGTVWTWGYNSSGQIGNGTTTVTGCACIVTPAQTTIANVTAIRAGDNHTLARRITGFIRAWGSNSFGQIGDGTNNSPLIPVQSFVNGGNVIFGAGGRHSLLSVPTIPTPRELVVRSQLGDGYVQFFNVVGEGSTTITAIDPTSTGLSVPAGLIIEVV